MSKRRTQKPPRGSYEVGYGKPPKASRFAPGRSGNPRGRPKRAKKQETLDEIIERVASELVPVVVNGRNVMMSANEAIATRLRNKALHDDYRAAREWFQLNISRGLAGPAKTEQRYLEEKYGSARERVRQKLERAIKAMEQEEEAAQKARRAEGDATEDRSDDNKD